MFGFTLQWPTVLTLIMFPVLVVMYVKLAKREEADSIERFGEVYLVHAKKTGRFFPKLKRTAFVFPDDLLSQENDSENV